MPLWKRILVEKRAVVVPLVIGVVANIAAYGLWVYPLGVKSAGAADRAAAASRAEQELSTFFDKVLPADLPSARNLTYATLPSLAKQSNVKLVDRRFEVDKTEKGARLGLLKVHTAWQCDYESFRRFIYALETASPFVIIDDVEL